MPLNDPAGLPVMGAALPPPGLTQSQGTGLPLPPAADLAFWRSEVQRSEQQNAALKTERQDNLDYYTGKPLASLPETEYVNVNVDFYQVEQKGPQLFFQTPELQLVGKGALTGQYAVLHAHRELLNELLGPDHANVLRTVQKAIKECLCTAGTGPVLIGFQPTLRSVQPPDQPGAIFGFNTPIQVPIHQSFYAQPFSSQKLLVPANWKDTDWDRAPWLGMKFRLPLALTRKEFPTLPPDFKGTTTKDEHAYDGAAATAEESGLNYVDGTVIWYRAAAFDETAAHPELFRELVLIDGLDTEARHRDSPHQTLLPTGQLSPDSLIGNPIHPLTIRDVPDSAFVPSDSQMTRPLVKELCRFRSQMVKERDANRQRVLYDMDAFPPETLTKLAAGEIGDLIGLEGGQLARGVASIMAPAVTGSSPRQTYLANDYITRDIAKTLGLDAASVGAKDDTAKTATELAIVDRASSVRIGAERLRVLAWYLGLVQKFSTLVCRYMLPAQAVPYIGQEAAQVWASWDKKAIDGRLAFAAKPDSQLNVDAAADRKFKLELYKMTAQDPNVKRTELLKELFASAGFDPTTMLVEQVPDKTPEPNISFRFSGEDLIGPQAPLVREILAQGGITLSQPAIDDAAGQLFKQVALGVRDASGKAVAATPKPAPHGGPVTEVRSLSKQESTGVGGTRPGPQPMEEVA